MNAKTSAAKKTRPCIVCGCPVGAYTFHVKAADAVACQAMFAAMVATGSK